MTIENVKSTVNPQGIIGNKRQWMWLLLGFLCIATVAFAAHALNGRGSYTGQTTFTPVGGDQVEIQIDAVGNVTHLGKSRVLIHTVADVSGPTPQPVPPSTGVLIAANGDKIYFNLQWTLQEVAPGVFDAAGPFEINGGTGRFEGATGSGDYEGQVDSNTGLVVADFIGTLLR